MQLIKTMKARRIGPTIFWVFRPGKSSRGPPRAVSGDIPGGWRLAADFGEFQEMQRIQGPEDSTHSRANNGWARFLARRLSVGLKIL